MKRLIATSPAVLGGIAAVTLVVGAGAAIAAWRIKSEEVVLTAQTATLSPGNKPVVVAEGNEVTVSWAPNKFGDRDVDSYRIKRYDLAGAPQQPHGGCEANVVAQTCTDSAVPAGSWRYTVVPVKGGWTGPESEKSDAVLVAADGKAVVVAVADVSVEKLAGPAAGPALVQVGEPGGTPPAGKAAEDQPPAWTLQAGDDGVLGEHDSLTYAGGQPVKPGTIIEGWAGKPRPVTMVAKAGDPALLTVDNGGTTVFGPLAVPGPAVAADSTFAATLDAVDGRIVLTLGAPQAPAATLGEATTPGGERAAPETPSGDPTTGDQPTGGQTTGDQTGGDPATGGPAAADRGATESTGGGSGPADPPATDGTQADPEGQPETMGTTAAPPATETPPTTAGDPAVVLLAAT